jgi:hypothetical protein
MPEPLKNLFFLLVFHDDLAAAVKAVYPEFDAEAFIASIYDGTWDQRELKDRMRRTTRDSAPTTCRATTGPRWHIFRRVARGAAGSRLRKNHFPAITSRATGCTTGRRRCPLWKHFTQHMSAEFAVRPFILQDPPRMMAQMLAWTQHRARTGAPPCLRRQPSAFALGMALPAFKADPTPCCPCWNKLRFDPSETVRRSVANNLNDIAKDNPQVVLDVLGALARH